MANIEKASLDGTNYDLGPDTIDASNITGTLPIANGGTGANSAVDAISNLMAGCTIYKQVYETFVGDYAKEWTVHGTGLIIGISNLQTYATTAGGGAGSEECYVNIVTNGNSEQLAYVNGSAVSTWGWTGAEAVGFAKVTDGQIVQCHSVALRGNITITKRINAVLAFGCTLTDV